MLLDDIEKNRYRVEQIFQRLMDAEDKDWMLTVLKTLVREGHLSDEQFERLAELTMISLLYRPQFCNGAMVFILPENG